MYIKPSPTFKMNKVSKLIMSSIKDKEQRNHFRRIMIQAQLQGAVQQRKEKSTTSRGPVTDEIVD